MWLWLAGALTGDEPMTIRPATSRAGFVGIAEPKILKACPGTDGIAVQVGRHLLAGLGSSTDLDHVTGCFASGSGWMHEVLRR
jgi:hypothetical protein